MISKLDYQNKYAYVNGQAIPYKLFLRHNKNVYIRVSRKLEIEVIANHYISTKALNEFINMHIYKFYEVIKHRQVHEQIDKNYQSIQIFGKRYNIKIIRLNKSRSYEIIHNDIYLNIKSHDDKLYLVKKMLTELTVPYIKQRFDAWSKKTQLKAKLFFKWMTTKWGVCNTREHKITLALQLGTNSKAGIDYVIVHEFVHLIQPDHSTKFWQIVASYIPNCKQLRNEINLRL